MSQSLPKDIIYLQLTSDAPENLRKVFRETGYTLNSVFKFPAIKEKLAEIGFSTLLINCGKIPDISKDIAEKLLKDAELSSLPIIFLCPSPDLVQETFNNECLLAQTLKQDIDPSILINELRIFNLHFEQYKEQLKLSSASNYELLLKKIKHKQPEPESQILIVNPIDLKNIADSLISKVSNFDVANIVETASFLEAISSEELKRQGFHPANHKISEYTDKIFSQLETRETYQVNRCIFINGKTCKLLNLTDNKLDDSISAGYLCIGELLADKDLIHKNLFIDPTKSGRLKAANLIKRSLDRSDLISTENLTAIITKVAGLMDSTAIAEDDDVSLVASAVILSKIMNVSCFKQGFWNTHGAYWLLSSIRRGDFKNIHPNVVAGAIAFTTHGIDCEQGYYELHKDNLPDLNTNEEIIPLSKLTPGMKLSKPLTSQKGREIIESDTVLDNDLIIRIMQISAIEPIYYMSIFK
jgi:hypothetical protein